MPMKVSEPMPYIHSFSDGYYLVNGFYVEPTNTKHPPRIQDRVYEILQDQYYGDASIPILFRHNGAQYHFRIEPADTVRTDTIEIPSDVVDEMAVDHVPSEQQFLMAKPGHARTIVELSDTNMETT